MGVQISARVSRDAQVRLADIARVTGRSRQAILEEAILREATALEIPEDYVVPVRTVLGRDDAKRLLEVIDHPPKATPTLKRALRRAGIDVK